MTRNTKQAFLFFSFLFFFSMMNVLYIYALGSYIQ